MLWQSVKKQVSLISHHLRLTCRWVNVFRKMEQLVLYVKALRALNLSLLFAQGEIRVGHLKPSNAVKNGKYYLQ